MKRRMVAPLGKDRNEDPLKRALRKILFKQLQRKNENNQTTKLDQKFLTQDPSSSNDQPSYLMARKLV